MKSLATLVAAVVLFWGTTSNAVEPARGFAPGDSVVITWTGARVLLGDKEVARLSLGQRMKVTEVRGAWIGGWMELDGKQVGGWLQNPLLERGATRRLSIDRDAPEPAVEPSDNSVPFAS